MENDKLNDFIRFIFPFDLIYFISLKRSTWPPGAFEFFNSFNVTRKKNKFKKHQCIKKMFVSFNLCICIFKTYVSYINIFMLYNLFYLLKWSDFGLLGHLTGKIN